MKFEMKKHPFKDGFTHSIHLADGNQKLVAEVRGGTYAAIMAAAPELLEALEKIAARSIDGEKLTPTCMANIARAAIAKIAGLV